MSEDIDYTKILHPCNKHLVDGYKTRNGNRFFCLNIDPSGDVPIRIIQETGWCYNVSILGRVYETTESDGDIIPMNKCDKPKPCPFCGCELYDFGHGFCKKENENIKLIKHPEISSNKSVCCLSEMVFKLSEWNNRNNNDSERTLRDYFAAHAPIARFLHVEQGAMCGFEMASIQAYKWADAMIKERSK